MSIFQLAEHYDVMMLGARICEAIMRFDGEPYLQAISFCFSVEFDPTANMQIG